MISEIHLFIIWEKAQANKYKIVEDLKGKFDIVDIVTIKWSTENFSNNMSRFYGTKLPKDSHKERHCGTGPFTAIIIRDNSPKYLEKNTSKGLQIVNINTFDAKQTYRQWTGGGHKIHSTNSTDETKHDIALLFGPESTYFSKTHPIWNKQEKIMTSDLVGANGWENLNQVFLTLNNAMEYVVLRNFESLEELPSPEHNDIDLLSFNSQDLAYVLNAKKIHQYNYRVQYKVDIMGTDIFFDLRYVGDNYYDKKWQVNLLKNRRYYKNKYVVDSHNYYYSLLYHTSIHKPNISYDYIIKLNNIGNELGIEGIEANSIDLVNSFKSIIEKFTIENTYSITEPIDLSVYYNSDYITKRVSLRRGVYNLYNRFKQSLKSIVHYGNS